MKKNTDFLMLVLAAKVNLRATLYTLNNEDYGA